MAKKLYVGNLSYQMTEEALKDIFAPKGEVLSAKIITDAATGRSKGFGFIEMASDEDADKAIAELNGTTVQDRAINVSEARPQRERGSRPGGGGGRGGQRGGCGGGGHRDRHAGDCEGELRGFTVADSPERGQGEPLVGRAARARLPPANVCLPPTTGQDQRCARWCGAGHRASHWRRSRTQGRLSYPPCNTGESSSAKPAGKGLWRLSQTSIQVPHRPHDPQESRRTRGPSWH